MSKETTATRSMDASIRYYDLSPTAASVTVRTYERAARTARALRLLGICWGLAAVSILIPIAHFLLVPAFFVAGPLLALSKHRERATVLTARGRCPSCGAEQTFEVNGAWKEEIGIHCATCRRGLRLAVANPAPGR